jgi:uncharacterized membrane protein (DUF4010 family)
VAAGTLAAVAMLRRTRAPAAAALDAPRHPLELRSALQMAVLFQLAVLALAAVRRRFGALGLLASGAVLGFTDVDALTVAMVRAEAAGAPAPVVGRALGLGMLANTILKLAIVLALGRGRFRVVAGLGLAAVAAAAALALPLGSPVPR